MNTRRARLKNRNESPKPTPMKQPDSAPRDTGGAQESNQAPTTANPTQQEIKGFIHRTTAVVGLLTAVVGVVSGALTTLLILRPNMVSSTTNLVEIGNVAVEPRVTLSNYLSHPTIRLLMPPDDVKSFREASRDSLGDVGTVVNFDFRMNGYRNIHLVHRWSLFDGETGERLGESEDIDPLPLKLRPEKKESDIGSWEFWVDTSITEAQSFFVRIELYDELRGTRLIFKDTEKFPRPR